METLNFAQHFGKAENLETNLDSTVLRERVANIGESMINSSVLREHFSKGEHFEAHHADKPATFQSDIFVGEKGCILQAYQWACQRDTIEEAQTYLRNINPDEQVIFASNTEKLTNNKGGQNTYQANVIFAAPRSIQSHYQWTCNCHTIAQAQDWLRNNTFPGKQVVFLGNTQEISHFDFSALKQHLEKNMVADLQKKIQQRKADEKKQ